VSSRFVRYQLPIILWGLLIFTASSIPAEDFPDYAIFSQDKLLHLLVFSIFALLLLVALRHQTRFPVVSRHTEWITLLVTLLYGALDEFHQLFVPGRSPDWRDLLADVAGGSLAVLIFRGVERWRSNRRRSNVVR
jgi:VanZ family protein